MNKNIIDFIAYKRQRNISEGIQKTYDDTLSEELIAAIRTLIQRLREHNPLKQTG